MKRRSFLSSSAALVGAGILGSNLRHGDQTHGHDVPTASLMTECASRFLAALDADQRAKVSIQFDSDERMNWHFIPNNIRVSFDSLGDRKGLPLREMRPDQKHLASALLAAGLSQTGYIKAITIMSLDEVLRSMGNDPSHRDSDNYYFSLFGSPSDTGTWGYRVEGHHLSQNYTIVNGKVVDGPSFFGANPAEIRQGPRKGLRALAKEDDLGLELINSLDEQQMKVAIVDPAAYPEILTAVSRKAALQGQPSGLAASKMSTRQFDALMTLMDEYARNVPHELAEGRMAQINEARRNIYFAWSGGVKLGEPHYYRVQASSFLIELDDTQDNANHIHSVWRDLNGDFGEDLLQQHYQTNHHK